MSVELFKKALIPNCPEIEQIEFRRSVFPEFRIKLNDQALLSDQVASAIHKAQQNTSKVLRIYSLVFINPLRELRDSPEHLQLAQLLCESLIEVHENGVTPRSYAEVWFPDLVKIAPSVVSVFEFCFDSDTHLSLPAITELSDELGMAFEILTVETLDLSGLESITPCVAKGICGDRIENLKLDGLKTLSWESAKAFSENFKGHEISMKGLVDLSPEVSEALSGNFCLSFSNEIERKRRGY
jgi:hypothetical protein